MSKPNESLPGRAKWLGIRLAAVSAVALAAAVGLLQLPSGATAGVAAVTATAAADDRVVSGLPPAPPPPASTPSSRQKGQGTYRLRCWQYGRLLFDEGPVTLGPEARQGAKLVATDRNGGSVIVTDSGWTTCQARPFPPAPNLALPR
ncbi:MULTISPECIES: hypothetical protein [unclassified Variovorax]|uniref:hypothetical protein n=1 Tax=unclassified Variovorax TaxID=663243 RepID=UPI00076D5504|nr:MULTISPECIES: hypothetical protein [unclassified Variovorax]KWT93231.1 hypothetical protein APY03_2928 [Variovorax sp. WDL1]PNG47360.1 hypothetical protein CHC06_07710 [Variovorax sp. B2]PNG47989.1 hypothetical protein CHC07_07158 [Variovorax sp. B4]VTV15260.1 hypothetical protein WDL1CHR_05685 [Variovorax sp. WDL1]